MTDKSPARLAMMNDSNDGGFRERTIDHHISFERIHRQPKYSGLEVGMLSRELQQCRRRQSYCCYRLNRLDVQ